MKYVCLIGLFASGFVAGINIDAFAINPEYRPEQWKVLCAVFMAVLCAVFLAEEPRK